MEITTNKKDFFNIYREGRRALRRDVIYDAISYIEDNYKSLPIEEWKKFKFSIKYFSDIYDKSYIEFNNGFDLRTEVKKFEFSYDHQDGDTYIIVNDIAYDIEYDEELIIDIAEHISSYFRYKDDNNSFKCLYNKELFERGRIESNEFYYDIIICGFDLVDKSLWKHINLCINNDNEVVQFNLDTDKIINSFEIVTDDELYTITGIINGVRYDLDYESVRTLYSFIDKNVGESDSFSENWKKYYKEKYNIDE